MREHGVQDEVLFLGQRPHDRADAEHHFGDRERGAFAIDQTVAVDGIDNVRRERAETEGSAVDQSELALLDLRHRAALPAANGVDEEENRAERRAHVVRHLDDGPQSIGAGETLVNSLATGAYASAQASSSSEESTRASSRPSIGAVSLAARCRSRARKALIWSRVSSKRGAPIAVRVAGSRPARAPRGRAIAGAGSRARTPAAARAPRRRLPRALVSS